MATEGVPPEVDPDELVKRILNAGMYQPQLQQLQQRIALGQQMMDTPGAAGAHVGQTYVASSPLEHLSIALRRMQGQRMLNEGMAGERGALDQVQQGRKSFADMISGLQAPVQAPPDSIAAPGMDQASQEQDRQSKLMRLGTIGALSGDPMMAKAGSEAAAMPGQQLAMAMQRQKLANEGPQSALGGTTPDVFNALTKRKTEEANTQNWDHFVNPVTGEAYLVNKKTGEKRPVGRVAGGGGAQATASPDALEPLPPAGKAADSYRKMADHFQKDMDAAAASKRTAFGATADVVFRGARNLAILDQKNADGSQRQLTLPEWQEVTGGLIAMQTGGAPTERMMREGLPNDVQGSAAGIMSWLTSAPHAPDRQAWIERFLSNVKREEDTANKFQRDTKLQRLPSNSQFFSLYPNRAKLAAAGYGIEPELIDQIRNGTFKPGGASPAPAAAAPGGATGGMVDVIAPDGREGQVPAANVQKAIARGYKLAGK